MINDTAIYISGVSYLIVAIIVFTVLCCNTERKSLLHMWLKNSFIAIMWPVIAIYMGCLTIWGRDA